MKAPEPNQPPEALEGRKLSVFFAIFPSIMLPMFLAVMDQTIVATALPAIAAEMGEVERSSWIIVSYLIAATIAAPVYGRLGDSLGRRRMMFVALSVFVVTSLLCAVAPSMTLLSVARFLQGLGGGGLMTLSQALIGESIPPRERARYQGYLAAVAVTANTFGPVVGGFLTEHFGWRSIFFISVPIGLVALALALRLPKHVTAERLKWRADPGGLLFFTVFVVTTLLALEQVQQFDLSALPRGLGLLMIGIIALVLLLWQEKRAESPLIPLGILRMPAIWKSDALAACHGAALVSLITFLPVYLQVVRGASPAESGFLLVPLTIGIGVGSLITGRLVSRTGRTTIFPIVGLALLTFIILGLAFFAERLSASALMSILLVNGLFMGTVMGVVQVMVQSTAGRLRLGEAAASVQLSRSIGAAVGTALVSTVLFTFLAIRNPDAARVFSLIFQHAANATSAISPEQRAVLQADIADAFRAAFLVIAGFTTGGFFLALTNPLRKI